MLLKCRMHYKSLDRNLPLFLMAIDWARPEQVEEAHRMLKLWKPMRPNEAITLLDAHFGDEQVRLYAVERISLMVDEELSLYMMELTMALSYEPQHYSPLGEFLL